MFIFSTTAKPSAPEGPLEVSDVTKEGCKLNWKPPADDGGEPIEGYVIEKFDPDVGVWIPAGTSAKPDFEVKDLTPGHEYQFRVKAVNKEGESEPLVTLAPIIAKDPFGEREEFLTGFPRAALWGECLNETCRRKYHDGPRGIEQVLFTFSSFKHVDVSSLLDFA